MSARRECVRIQPRIPMATYRLQFNRNFRFSDAANIVGYLNDLGISDIYSSPFLGAKTGSLHGYDIVNHGTLNPEVGSPEDLQALCAILMKHDMGNLIDIVPNHMGIGSENPWWMDLLENGPSSMYARFFDIDWDPVKRELRNRLLLPVLGAQYGTVLENREMQLCFEAGAFFITYYEHRFPVRPQTYSAVLRYGLGELESSLGTGDPDLTELLSIITALDHLPPYTEEDTEKVRERLREKEVVKRRLQELCEKSAEIRNFIERNIGMFNGIKGEPRSFDLFDALINDQAYRLSYWRVAAEEINYRRFFDINELAAIRVQDPAVFSETHRLIFSLIRQGKATGLRVDHPDGLYDPAGYFRWLQRNCFLHSQPGGDLPCPAEQDILDQYEETLHNETQYKPFYIVGEKILLRGERMPEDWPIFSTTGYVFLNSLNGVFIDTEKSRAFDDIYAKFIRTKLNFAEITYEKKKLILQVAMSSEVNTLGHFLNRISEKDRHTRDFTLNSLTGAIIEVIAFFPVYRTYTNQTGANDIDRKYIELAVTKAKRKNPAINASVFDFLRDVLTLNYPDHFNDPDKKEWHDFAMRFQQITGPVMAKGVEDTAFYIYNRLVSLNEVGGSPERFGTTLDTFHGQNIERTKFWPHAMLSTSTHDTKRSEDVRSRINVLSELPGEWKNCLSRWSRLNRKKKMLVDGLEVPDRNEEYLLYQTLLGAWPLGEPARTEYESFKSRIKEYMLKAVREAKVNSSWISPNEMYEDILMMFIERLLEPYPDSPFLRDFLPFQQKIAYYGMFNSVSQTLLKITCPGVPDFYQGTEVWDLSLVDPDNRRAVDYPSLIRMLDDLKVRQRQMPLSELSRDLTGSLHDGAIKMYLIYRALGYRRGNRELFDSGEYVPLGSEGLLKNNICAFARRKGETTVVIAVPRLYTQVVPIGPLPLGEGVWQGSRIILPPDLPGSGWKNIFTDEIVAAVTEGTERSLQAQDMFRNFPVAMLEMTKDEIRS